MEKSLLPFGSEVRRQIISSIQFPPLAANPAPGKEKRRSYFLKSAAGICGVSVRKQPARQRFFSFPIGRGRMTSYLDLVTYSMVSIESTILIFEIFRKGIAVANKQAPTAKRVASRIDTTGIATS